LKKDKDFIIVDPETCAMFTEIYDVVEKAPPVERHGIND
jgi:hypothetical protein